MIVILSVKRKCESNLDAANFIYKQSIILIIMFSYFLFDFCFFFSFFIKSFKELQQMYLTLDLWYFIVSFLSSKHILRDARLLQLKLFSMNEGRINKKK